MIAIVPSILFLRGTGLTIKILSEVVDGGALKTLPNCSASKKEKIYKGSSMILFEAHK